MRINDKDEVAATALVQEPDGEDEAEAGDEQQEVKGGDKE
jgi:hypothetical protein